MHQVIYTSCRRGIEGASDGQQIYSYDSGFREVPRDQIKGIFSYQLPSLPPGQVMTEELAPTMPRSFTWRRFGDKNCALTLATYLGRDYMGSAGRFGNYLCHSVVGDAAEFDLYPCELYGNGLLRSSMEFDEVNSTETPPFLDEPVLEPGDEITPDSVLEFLEEDDRMERFRQMLHAVLHFTTEKRRLIICDEPENIIFWIAALQYAFPLANAKKITFSSYDFDPELSGSQICGVISSGTRYDARNYIASRRHYVFDFLQDQYSEVEEDSRETPLLDALETWFSLDYDDVKSFHEFLQENTTYDEADLGYADAFLFYKLCSQGLSELESGEFEFIRDFSLHYADDGGRRMLMEKLLENTSDIRDLPQEDAVGVYAFIAANMRGLGSELTEKVGDLLLERILFTLTNPDVAEDDFDRLYQSVVSDARNQGISVVREFFRPETVLLLQNALEGKRLPAWKYDKFANIFREHVRFDGVSREDMEQGHLEGDLYALVLKTAYDVEDKKGEEFIDAVLKSYQDDAHRMLDVVFTLDGALRDDEAKIEQRTGYLWGQVLGTAAAGGKESQDLVYQTLASERRYQEMTELLCLCAANCADFEAKHQMFLNYWKQRVEMDAALAGDSAGEVLAAYVKQYQMAQLPNDKKIVYAFEMLSRAAKVQANDGQGMLHSQAMGELLESILAEVSYKEAEERYRYLITDVNSKRRSYYEPIQGKALLMEMGLNLSGCKGDGGFRNELKTLHDKGEVVGDLFSRFSAKEAKKYCEWAMRNISTYAHMEADDFKMFWDLLGLQDKTSHGEASMEVLKYITQELLQETKKPENDQVLDSFVAFVHFLFDNCNPGEFTTVSKVVSGLGKQKIAALDEKVKGQMKDAYLTKWNNLVQEANNTGLIGRIFK